MSRRPTFSELAWPDEPADRELAIEWAESVTMAVLDLTWRAFDALRQNVLSRVDVMQPLEQLERDLTRNHFIEIQLLFSRETDGYAAFVPQHEWPETESRTSASARPPAYDFAFIALANRRWAWPIEAKVVATPHRLSEYLRDVSDKFIGCIAAPLVGEGAMLGYLLTDDTTLVFENVGKALNQALSVAVDFRQRPHRISRHIRKNAPELCLHHLLMSCTDIARARD